MNGLAPLVSALTSRSRLLHLASASERFREPKPDQPDHPFRPMGEILDHWWWLFVLELGDLLQISLHLPLPYRAGMSRAHARIASGVAEFYIGILQSSLEG